MDSCDGTFKKLSDPALSGGPSNKSVADDDPIWEPINGISWALRGPASTSQTRGVTDEPGMIALRAGARVATAADTKAALDGWVPSGWASRWPSDSGSASSSAY